MENLNGQHTHLEYCQALGIKPDTARVSFNRAGFSGWNKHGKPTPQQFKALYAGKSTDKPETRTEISGNADTPQTEIADRLEDAKTPELTTKKIDWSGMFARVVLMGVVLGHAGLVAYDCWILFTTAGAIIGVISFLTVVACLILSADPSHKDTSMQMLWFVWLLDAAAWFVHEPTFWHSSSVGWAMGVTRFQVGFIAAFVCLCSMAALYFFRDSKLGKHGAV